MNSNKLIGIAIPIEFNYNYRGKRHGSIDMYFSHQAIGVSEIDPIEPGKTHLNEIKHLVNHGLQGDFDCLIPQKKQKLEKFDDEMDIPSGTHFSIGVIDDNPTTATYAEILAFYPCKENNLNRTLELFNYPDFYLSQKNRNFTLHIKTDKQHYNEIPAQKYSPRCFHGKGHSVITLKTKSGVLPIYQYSKLNWNDLLKQLNNEV